MERWGGGGGGLGWEGAAGLARGPRPAREGVQERPQRVSSAALGLDDAWGGEGREERDERNFPKMNKNKEDKKKLKGKGKIRKGRKGKGKKIKTKRNYFSDVPSSSQLSGGTTRRVPETVW